MGDGRVNGTCRAKRVMSPACRPCAKLCGRPAMPGSSNLTLFAFSSENWKRPATEVGALMGLFRLYFRNDLTDLVTRGVRIRVIGNRSRVEDDIRQMIEDAEHRTLGNTGLNLTFAFDYGGQEEIAAAARELARAAAKAGSTPRRLRPNSYPRGCSQADCPNPIW